MVNKKWYYRAKQKRQIANIHKKSRRQAAKIAYIKERNRLAHRDAVYAARAKARRKAAFRRKMKKKLGF